MSERTFTLLTMGAAGLFSVLTSFIAGLFAWARVKAERKLAERAAHLERVADAYVGLLSVVDQTVRTVNKLPEGYVEKVSEALSRAKLLGSEEVLAKTRQFGIAVEEWSDAVGEGEKEEPPDLAKKLAAARQACEEALRRHYEELRKGE